MDTAEESELVHRMKHGDRAAFDALYVEYYDRLYRTACMITGNQADGEDVTQETFIKMYLHCAELKKSYYSQPILITKRYSIAHLVRCAINLHKI